MATVVANVVLNLLFVRVLGYRGLALGTSLAAVFNASVLLVLLRHHLQGIDGRRIGISFVKILVASAAMGATAYVAEHWLSTVLPGARLFMQGVRLTLTIGVSIGSLAVAAYLLRIREFHARLNLVLRRVRRT
jgi:putative peptidoglycan lipid II flippase